MQIVFTAHAQETLNLRQIDRALVVKTISDPDDIIESRLNRQIRIKDFGNALLRVIGVIENDTFVVITQYWFSKTKL